MRLSRFFMPTLKETPSEAEIVSHRLMLRAGMIRQSSAGIYSWLPLGYRVLKKIEQIVREREMRKLELSQKRWSRQEEASFLRVIAAFGVEYHR